jgi:hypothetical protein
VTGWDPGPLRALVRPRVRTARHDHHMPCASGHAGHLTFTVTAETAGMAADRAKPRPGPPGWKILIPNGPGLRATRAPAPCSAGARRRGPAPGAALCDYLPTCQARVPRRARPEGLVGPVRAPAGQSGLAGKRKAPPRPCPAPHQPGHRPNNRPPLPSRSILTRRANTARKGMAADDGNRERPGKT